MPVLLLSVGKKKGAFRLSEVTTRQTPMEMPDGPRGPRAPTGADGWVGGIYTGGATTKTRKQRALPGMLR